MSTAEAIKPSVTEAAAETVATKVVYVKSRIGGTMPLEWPKVDPATNRRAIDFDVKDSEGNVIEKITYRNLDFGDNGLQAIDLSDPEDVAFLERVRDWLANSRDKRIAKYNVELIEGGNVEPRPFNNYESIRSDVVVGMIQTMLGDDEDANRVFLEQCARYELQLDEPRQDVLVALDELGGDPGDEAGDDGVIDE